MSGWSAIHNNARSIHEPSSVSLAIVATSGECIQTNRMHGPNVERKRIYTVFQKKFTPRTFMIIV